MACEFSFTAYTRSCWVISIRSNYFQLWLQQIGTTMDDCYELKPILMVAYLSSQSESETAQATNQTFYRESSFDKNAEIKVEFFIKKNSPVPSSQPAKPQAMNWIPVS